GDRGGYIQSGLFNPVRSSQADGFFQHFAKHPGAAQRGAVAQGLAHRQRGIEPAGGAALGRAHARAIPDFVQLHLGGGAGAVGFVELVEQALLAGQRGGILVGRERRNRGGLLGARRRGCRQGRRCRRFVGRRRLLCLHPRGTAGRLALGGATLGDLAADFLLDLANAVGLVAVVLRQRGLPPIRVAAGVLFLRRGPALAGLVEPVGDGRGDEDDDPEIV